MPNRILKESICTSESIDKLKPFEEVFFYRLMVQCDDYGRMDGRIRVLKAKLFPLKDSVTLKNIEDGLRVLVSIGLVKPYTVGEQPFLFLPTWGVHQQIRAKKSKYPHPSEADITCNQMISDDNQSQSIDGICPRNPIQSEYNNGDCVDVFFETLWAAYPKKKGKGSVSDTQKKKLHKIGLDEMLRCVERYKAYIAENNIDDQYVKHGSTFFNSGYVDYLDKNHADTSGAVGMTSWNTNMYDENGERIEV